MLRKTPSKMMNILQVGNTDMTAARFNGHLLHKTFQKRGFESSHCVWEKQGTDDHTWELCGLKYRLRYRFLFEFLEKELSLDSILYPFSYGLMLDKRFRASDIIHYHLIHKHFFSITALPFLSHLKPSVWTLHDPWAMTGHCIYPYDCLSWKSGCGNCPRLTTPFSLKKDLSSSLWSLKKILYHLSRFDVIVASKWMLSMAENSPLFSKFRLHYIPFGLNLDVFYPMDVEKAKRDLGILPGSLVIGFRATDSEFKGFSYIKKCLHRVRSNAPICLLTFDVRGLADEFRGKYQIVDLGWVNDESLMAQALNATDLFLMPSLAEAFGMMAMEAMACGKPVVVFDKTALSEVVFAPKGGIAAPYGDEDAFCGIVQKLIDDPAYRSGLGASARRLAVDHYDFEDHVNKIICLYEDVAFRWRSEKKG